MRKGESCRFSLESIASDDSKVAFYNDFHSYDHLKCFDFLGPPASQLIPERYLTTVTKKLLEQDIPYGFGISQSTVSRIFTSSWINFMDIQFQKVPLWPPRDFVRGHMPVLFKEKYM